MNFKVICFLTTLAILYKCSANVSATSVNGSSNYHLYLDQATDDGWDASRQFPSGGQLWQVWHPQWNGHLAKLEVLMGSTEPCIEYNGILKIMASSQPNATATTSKVVFSMPVRTTCNSCHTTRNTCLFAPGCRYHACLAWQSFSLPADTASAILLDSSVEYSFVLSDFQPAQAVPSDKPSHLYASPAVGVSVHSLNHGGRSSLLLSNPSMTPSFSQYVFRTFMSNAKGEEVYLSDSGPRDNNPSSANNKSEDNHMSKTVVPTVVVGLVVVCIFVVLIAMFIVRRTQKRQSVVKEFDSDKPFVGDDKGKNKQLRQESILNNMHMTTFKRITPEHEDDNSSVLRNTWVSSSPSKWSSTNSSSARRIYVAETPIGPLNPVQQKSPVLVVDGYADESKEVKHRRQNIRSGGNGAPQAGWRSFFGIQDIVNNNDKVNRQSEYKETAFSDPFNTQFHHQHGNDIGFLAPQHSEYLHDADSLRSFYSHEDDVLSLSSLGSSTISNNNSNSNTTSSNKNNNMYDSTSSRIARSSGNGYNSYDAVGDGSAKDGRKRKQKKRVNPNLGASNGLELESSHAFAWMMPAQNPLYYTHSKDKRRVQEAPVDNRLDLLNMYDEILQQSEV